MIIIKTLAATGFEAVGMGMISGPGDITVSASTAEPGSTPDGSFPTFELIASDQVWFSVLLIDDTNKMTALYSIGPYTVGDIGTEVAPEL